MPFHARAQHIDFAALEAIMHRDPGCRGLACYLVDGATLDAGQLKTAALDLAERARRVAIVTGFCIAIEDRVTAETDGPPGALYLAQVLVEWGAQVTLITDRYARPIVKLGAALVGLPADCVIEFPFAADEAEHWIDTLLAENPGLSHLIAIERPGPCAAGSCHTMRGDSIDEHTAPTHLLFERVAERGLPITTMGIGDGGNEIGMGRFTRQNLVAAIATGCGETIACTTATDFALIAGTSNWGAYALAIAVARLRGLPLESRWLLPAGQQELVERLVAEGGAVDGRTRLSEATVDGLSLEDYLGPLADMLAVQDQTTD